jgi:hypothetical protein
MILRILVCVMIFSICTYSYIDRNNQITSLRFKLPELSDQIVVLQEKNASLRYEIERSESPLRLMELARQPEYSHLHHPRIDEVRTVQ